ncbi:hypothetical protein [Hymenobacter rigui]|uniref:Uncharacterized protein n=1 Tax=Hymenobacter rigui TaxID=334424 RepID=A0A428KU35_9BACT|nr:hypothetical protein [Hymenobacter rigui]RSK50129.1 hypothetical protein EI291_05610 [Hymenobacter rigui]
MTQEEITCQLNTAFRSIALVHQHFNASTSHSEAVSAPGVATLIDRLHRDIQVVRDEWHEEKLIK